jgi:hypothetical protein
MQIKDITSAISGTINKLSPSIDKIPVLSDISKKLTNKANEESKDETKDDTTNIINDKTTNGTNVLSNETFDNQETKQTTGDPNTFNAKRMFEQIYTQLFNIFKIIIVPYISLMMAMIVANEMIVYSVPIRIIFFIFTLILVLFYPLVTILLPIFYLLKGGYSYYINNMTNGPKQHIMPTIYALLPITTYKPTSSFWSVVFYPFTYAKTIKGEQTLPENMKDYFDALVSSFEKYNSIKGLPLFKDKIQIIEKQLKELHAPSESFLGIKNTTPESTSNPSAPSAPSETEISSIEVRR